MSVIIICPPLVYNIYQKIMYTIIIIVRPPYKNNNSIQR